MELKHFLNLLKKKIIVVLIVPFMELKQMSGIEYRAIYKSLNRTFYGIETPSALESVCRS